MARYWFALAAALFVFYSCQSIRDSKPIMPNKDYERLLAGRFDADYVGTENCLKACHYHDQLKKDFEASTMGVQLSRESGLPVVDCESCHGPGSLAIQGLTPEKVEAAAREGKQLSCNYDTLIDIKHLPAGAKSLICLKCHTKNATFNLHLWAGSPHALHGVSCPDCHNIHAGPDLIVSPKDTAGMCWRCHPDVRAQFNMLSHHPVPEGRMFCTDCHNPHGSLTGHLLKKDTVKATCTQCHAEKEGPFTFEHAETTENCLVCHYQHGSPNDYLLKASPPFLCLQCHIGHQIDSTVPADKRAALYTRCTDCHPTIHGTDIPSPSGAGDFTR